MNRASASSRKAASGAPRETDVQADKSDSLPWFKHRMLWLVIAIPALTVAGCLLTIFLAINNPDQIVSDPADTNASAPSARR